MKVIKEGFDMLSDMVAYLKELNHDGVKMTKMTAGNKLMRKFPSATEADVAKAIKQSKLKLEAMNNIPDKATTVLNPTMARAKEVSDKKDKDIASELKKAGKAPEMKKPFLGSVKPNVPKAIKEPVATLDESLFDDLNESSGYADKGIIDRGSKVKINSTGEEGEVVGFRYNKAKTANDAEVLVNGKRVVVDGKDMTKLESVLKEEPDFDLRPQFDSRKSFYSKARVNIDKDGNQTLYSYNTPVARIKNGTFELLPMWNSSQTTLRHVKEFIRQNGMQAGSVRDIAKTYPVGEVDESMCEDVDEKIWNKVMKELDIGTKRKVDKYPNAKRYNNPNVTYDGDIEVVADSEEGLEFAKQVAKDYGCDIHISQYHPPVERNLNNAEKGYPTKYVAKVIIPRVKNESLTEGYSKDYDAYDLIDECKRIYTENRTPEMDDNDRTDLMQNAIEETIDNMTIYNSDILHIIMSDMNWGYINDLGLVEGVDNVYDFGRMCIYEGLMEMCTEMVEDAEKEIADAEEDNLGA